MPIMYPIRSGSGAGGVYFTSPDYVISLKRGYINAYKCDGSKQYVNQYANGNNSNLRTLLGLIWADSAQWIHFKKGTYQTSVAIDNTPTLTKMTGDGMDITIIQGATSVANGVLNIGVSSVEIVDLTFDANSLFNNGVHINAGFSNSFYRVQALNAVTSGFLVDAGASNGHKFDFCKSKQHTLYGMDFVTNNTDTWVRGFTASVSGYDHNLSAGIRCNASGMQFTHNHLWGNDYGYILADVSSIEQIVISGDYIESNVRHNILMGQHSVRSMTCTAAFWTNPTCSASRTTRSLSFPSCGADIYADTTGSYRHEGNSFDCTFNSGSYQSYAVYRNTYYFRYNHIMSRIGGNAYSVANYGEGASDASSWNIIDEPNATDNLALLTQSGAWASPIMGACIGRYEGRMVPVWNTTQAAGRLYIYLNAAWRYVALT
jgi:hypothetical protein